MIEGSAKQEIRSKNTLHWHACIYWREIVCQPCHRNRTGTSLESMNGGIFSKGINKKEQRYRYELYCMSYTTQLSIKIGVNKKTSKKKLTMGIAPCYKYSFQYPLLFISQQMCVYFSWRVFFLYCPLYFVRKLKK